MNNTYPTKNYGGTQVFGQGKLFQFLIKPSTSSPLRGLSVVVDRKTQRKKICIYLIDVYFVKVNQLVMTIATFY